jgi:integrase
MQVADVDLLAQTPAFVIRVNSNRGLKTIASARTIPIPAPILKLGFAKYVKERQQRRDVDLFPELAASAAVVKGTHSSFGDKIDHHFNKAVDLALGANREVDGRRKTFHSFRHYVATKLDNHDAVRDKTVQDLLGHENVGTTNKIYRDPTPLPIMLDAIEKLPDFTIAAQAALSHARVAAPRPRNKKRTRTAQNTAYAN